MNIKVMYYKKVGEGTFIMNSKATFKNYNLSKICYRMVEIADKLFERYNWRWQAMGEKEEYILADCGDMLKMEAKK